ncbi:MAG: hypothetical protein AUK47_12220, partial [Deltaproteobacteria bacterium CG2_30_63_29]
VALGAQGVALGDRRPRPNPMTTPPQNELAQQISLDEIRYSCVWEDSQLLIDGLEIEPDDDVLCVASGGDNVLALLLEEPRSLTAVDLNPAQIAWVELKLAGIRRLEHLEFCQLLGVRDGADRAALYVRVRDALSAASAAFWDARTHKLQEGVFMNGRLEQYFRGFQTKHLPELWPADLVARLFDAPELASQARLFESEAFTPEFQERFRWYFGRQMMGSRGRDPAQFKYVDEADDVGAAFLLRFHRACTELPLRGNFYLERFLTGAIRDLEHGPRYLHPAEFERLRGLVDRVELRTAELEALPHEAQFTKAVLSDALEYLSQEAAERLFVSLAEQLRPGGRLAYWDLLVERPVAGIAADRFLPLSARARALWLRDRAWFYRGFHLYERRADAASEAAL